ncbi:thiamine pyrophosphate-binding protein [Halomonas sp. V046]|uniref:thiamine pyrophosphate-binding protein n=1 Tax=Halomonas sp. V046 TaxID=3459611 RepID=UPI004043BB6B
MSPDTRPDGSQPTATQASSISCRNGGQILMDQLRRHGARRVFLVPGESYLPCIDALNEHRGAIEPIVCRQESGAAYMAEAYGKLTNEPGICFVTRGPGATNASIGVHTAYQDSTPMILFIGQVGNDFVEREAFQEIDYRRMFGPMAKWVAQIDATDRIPEYIARAYRVATSGRPGPVVLALPEDTLWGEAEVADTSPMAPLHAYPGAHQLAELKARLAEAERPLLLIGGSGWTEQAQAQMAAFAERFDLPVGVAWRRLECFDQRDPHFVGHVGFAMHDALRERLTRCDLLIAVGTRMGEPTSEGYSWISSPTPSQDLVHVYPDPEELGRVYHAELAINADVVGFAAALDGLAPDAVPRWSEETRAARAEYLATLEPQPSPGPLSLDRVAVSVDRVLDGHGCITVGAGNYALYAHRYVRFSGLGSSLAPTVGSMGYGLPAAISFKLEHPDRPSVCFAGDGCFQMNLQELGVALQYRLGIVVILFNNGMWGTIRAHQENDFPGREIALTFLNPAFTTLVESYGGQGEVVDRDDDFEPALRRALDFAEREKLPALIELRYEADGIAPGKRLSAIRDAALARQSAQQGT